MMIASATRSHQRADESADSATEASSDSSMTLRRELAAGKQFRKASTTVGRNHRATSTKASPESEDPPQAMTGSKDITVPGYRDTANAAGVPLCAA